MNFPIYLVFSTIAGLVHSNSECKTVSCDCQIHNVEILKQLIDNRIGAALAKIPVAGMLIFSVDGMLIFSVEDTQNSSRIARVKDFNVKTLVTGRSFDEVDISNPSLPATGANNIISYQPGYQDTTDFGHGGSKTTAILFINIREVFPCVKRLPYRYHPVCKIFTHEEDGFRSYRPITEAADSGNHFRIFSPSLDIPTYGYGIQGCAEFTVDCLPTHHRFVITCFLPC